MLIPWSEVIGSATPWYCYPFVFALYTIMHLIAYTLYAWGFAVCLLIVAAPVYGLAWLIKRLK